MKFIQDANQIPIKVGDIIRTEIEFHDKSKNFVANFEVEESEKELGFYYLLIKQGDFIFLKELTEPFYLMGNMKDNPELLIK